MKFLSIIIVFLLISVFCVSQFNLHADAQDYSTWQKQKNVRVKKGEKKYGSSLVLEKSNLNELVKVLEKYTGAKIEITSPAKKDFDIELFFEEKNAARKLIWYAEHSTAKTYYETDEKIPEKKVTIHNKDLGWIVLENSKRISLEIKNIKLLDLLRKLGRIGKIDLKLDKGLNLENIWINITLKKITIEEAIQTLVKMENLKLKKIKDSVYLVTRALEKNRKNFPKLSGPYLGQKTPGTSPEVFAPGIVSTVSHEFSCCFSPDGDEFYFTRRHPELNQTVIMVSKKIGGFWTEPDVAPFVEKQFSFEPWVTADNKRLYFQSGKPIPGQPGPPMNVLYVERKMSGWGKPINPGPPFNPAKVMHIGSTINGTIYTTDISKGPGTECLAVIRKINGKYQKVDKLGLPLNAIKQSMHPYIAPDESYMIFSTRRPSEKIKSFLYISYKNPEGNWGEPRNIDFEMSAGLPFVTNDGKFLFFTSGERGKGDIYWVSAKIFKELRPKKL